MKPETGLVITENQAALTASDTNFINDVIQMWVNEADVETLTEKSYKTAAKMFTTFLSSNRITLSEETLKDWRRHLENTRAASTARLYFTITKTFVKWLAKRGYCAYDFGAGIKNVPLSNEVHSRDALTVVEAAKVMNSFHSNNKIKDLRDRAMIAVMITTGVRTVTVVNLKVGDIRRKQGQWVMACKVKARKEKVTVNLPDETKKILDEYLKARGKKLSPSDTLFVSTSRRNYGKKLTTQAVSRVAKAAFRRCDLDSAELTAHSCRHSFATISLLNGVSLDATSKALHHKDVRVTERYRHDISSLNNTATRVVAAAVFGEIKKQKGGIGNAQTN